MLTASNPVAEKSLVEIRRQKVIKIKALLEQKKRRGKEDLFFFCQDILGYSEVSEQPHRELTNFINAQEKAEKKRELILLPRGSFKTSVVTIGYTMQRILKNPNLRILITGEDLAKTKQFLGEIKSNFENDRFKAIYGNWAFDAHYGVWTGTHINVRPRTSTAKEFTITAAGLKVTKVGLHYDLIIADDLVSEKNITTPELMKSVIKYYKLLLSILEPTGTLIIIGTRWYWGDLYGYILEKERIRELNGKKPRFAVLKRGCYDGPEGLYFPTRLTRSYLREQRKEQGLGIFANQYLNEPTDDETAEFKKSWFRFYTPGKPPQTLNTFILSDPGGSKKGDDFNAFVSPGISPRGNVFLLRAWRGHCDPFDFCHKLFDEVVRLRGIGYNPMFIGMETSATQKTYKWIFEQVRKERGISIALRELKPSTRISKEQRIRGFLPIVAKRQLYLPGESYESLTGFTFVLADEMLRFPRGVNDDLLDSLAYITEFYFVPQKIRQSNQPQPGTLGALYRKLDSQEYLGKLMRSKKPLIWGVNGV